MRFVKVFSASSVLAVSLFLSGSSVAGLGVECLPGNGSGAFASNEGIMFTSSFTASIGANCKIRESSIAPAANYVVKVFDNSSTHNISCSVVRVNSTGAASWVSASASSAGVAGTQNIALNLSAPGGSGNIWVLVCNRTGAGAPIGTVGIKSFPN
jgi:hypothetical protein